jgi:hypothetical protein
MKVGNQSVGTAAISTGRADYATRPADIAIEAEGGARGNAFPSVVEIDGMNAPRYSPNATAM